MTKDIKDDLGALLELLQQAVALARRMRLGMLEYLLDMAVVEATEQVRLFDRGRRSHR